MEIRAELEKVGTVVKDSKNVNGRFIEVRVKGDVRQIAADLNRQFKRKNLTGHVSNLSYIERGEYSFQITTRRPSLVAPGLIYQRDAFGEQIYITVAQGREW